MTESFGRFNEFLVAGDLVRNERDPSRKSALRQELLGRAFVLYGAATEGAVEIALHDAVIRGERPSPEQFAALTRSAGSRFSDRFEQKNDALLWTRVESYYGDPLHSTSSMISSLISLVLYRRFRENPARFVPGYAALLRNGYDAPSKELLRRFVAIDLDSPGLVAEAVGELKALGNEGKY